VNRHLSLVSTLLLLVPAAAWSQQSSNVPVPASEQSFQTQVLQKLADMQAQIDALKATVAARDEQIQALTRSTSGRSTPVVASSASPSSSVQTPALEAASSSVVVGNGAQVRPTTTAHPEEQNASLRYKGITLTPGGFLAGESIWRQRAMNADIYTNFNATPYMNSGEAHTSEWVPSARQSRLSLLANGKTPFGNIAGFFEGDFLSAGTTSNNLQSNSYTLRVRQAWGQASFGHAKFTAGQMWTLLTEDKKSTDPGQESAPLIFDGNGHVGYTYIRQMGYRFQDAITPSLTLAVALENSQYQFNATNAPSNFFFGNTGAAGGLNNPSANYTNQVAPDILVKAAFDPGYGHYEIGGVGRFFRDRFYPVSGSAANAQNDTRFGGGFVANARFPVSRLDVGLHLVAGDGTGRYGASLLPDITVRPDGTLSPLRNLQGMLSLEYHASTKLDVFGYWGNEYVQRTYYRNGAGTLVGYAPPSASNAGCGVEGTPSAGTGYAPGTSTCTGATRDLNQGSFGWVYKIYSGPAGRIQYGIAYSYLTRAGWTGVGGAPKATNNFVYTSFRYYLP
jgi:hypothetical protein